ncbi:MAG: methyltransferase domain-containing protein, partial [Nitrospirae bacterium]|nr:methyltransferase domain-containing protein [Candidatus Troglogloeales bacterium]
MVSHAIDQSDFQQAKAKKKAALNGVHFKIGDAEALPYQTDRFDRYVSSGSIEYWPDPQRAVAESYRVIKEGGLAVNLGPVQPKNFLGKTIANIFMLFPTVDEYLLWYQEAGFVDVRYILLRPDWVKKEDYGIAIVGRKPKPGASPWIAPTSVPEESLHEKSSSRKNPLLF